MDSVAYAAVKANDHRKLAARLREVNTVKASPDARNGAGLTMLHVACYQGSYDCARLLLEKGQDIHAAGTECKSTPLQFAALSGNDELVSLLLRYQARVNSQNTSGKAALHFAAVGGHVSIIRALIAAGADPHLEDEQGRCARQYADNKGQHHAAVALQRFEGPQKKWDDAGINDREQDDHDDCSAVRLTFEKLDHIAIQEQAELNRRYEDRRRRIFPAEKSKHTDKEGGLWIPIGDGDASFRGRIPRLSSRNEKKTLAKKFSRPAGRGVCEQKGEENKPGFELVSGPKSNAVASLNSNMNFLDKELQDIIGVDHVKNSLRSLCKKVSVDQKRAKFGFRCDHTLNMLFLGAPGTGKTSMARVVARLLQHLGILEKGHLVEVTRKDLVAEYSGQSAIKTAAKVEEALGGVLFVDEAYALKHDASKDGFGQEAVDTLVAEMEKYRSRLVVIMAGYTKEMEDFMRSNAGLESRFPHTFEFANYSYEEMAAIFTGMAAARKLNVDVELQRLPNLISRNMPKSEAAKGNARAVRNLLDRVLARQTDRVADMGTSSMASLLTLTEADFDFGMTGSAACGLEETGDGHVKAVMEDLDAIVGVPQGKELFQTLRAKVTVASERRALGLPAEGAASLHMIFQGNPGTGKTTVARLMGRLFHAVGLLRRGHLVEVSRVDLVGQHIGETSLKTQRVAERAEGGVLFVDEAYTLVSDSRDSFGKEALESLMKSMEDMREELVVIFAGYSNEMQKLMQANPGLKSRFPNVVNFADYSSEELLEIARRMLAMKQMILAPQAAIALRQVCEAQAALHDPLSGNARFIRNLLEQAIMRQAHRLMALPSRSREQLVTLHHEDFAPPTSCELANLCDCDHGKTMVLASQTKLILTSSHASVDQAADSMGGGDT